MSKLINIKATFARLLRYGLVGLTLNGAGYLIYLIVTWLGSGPKITMTILYGAGALMGYFGHRRLAFHYDGGILGSAVRYGMAHLCGYGLNLVLLVIFVDLLGYPHQFVQALAIFIVAGFLFVCFNLLVFPQKATQMGDGNGRPAQGRTVPQAADRGREGA